jgi:hypothetical protein
MEMWTLHDGINLLAEYEVMSLGITDSNHFYELRSSTYKRYEKLLRSYFKNNNIKPVVVRYDEHKYDSEEDYDEGNHSIDFINSRAYSESIIKWASSEGLRMPKEFIVGIAKEGLDIVDAPEIEPFNEEGCVSYPDYAGIRLPELTEELFGDIKKYYGMYRAEDAKSKKAIRIATSIGLLFYENGLKKPATKEDFKVAYKESIGGIPMRLVEIIYNALPDKYKSLAGKTKEVEDVPIDDATLDTIIESSIVTGFIRSENEIEDAKDLGKKLKRLEFETPPEQYLKAISGTCKRAYKKYQSNKA